MTFEPFRNCWAPGSRHDDDRHARPEPRAQRRSQPRRPNVQPVTLRVARPADGPRFAVTRFGVSPLFDGNKPCEPREKTGTDGRLSSRGFEVIPCPEPLSRVG